MKETELCDLFIGAAESYGWTSYPETSGWDILLVRGEVQIGVQAKTRANVKVIAQCLPPVAWFGRRLEPSVRRKIVKRGPTYRAILVPGSTAHHTKKDLCEVCQALGIWVFADDKFGWRLIQEGCIRQEDYNWEPDEPEWLPDVIPQVAAGSKSPIQLTKWKQSALRLFALATVRGYVTSRDAKELGLNMGAFVDRWQDTWLERAGTEGRAYKYALLPKHVLKKATTRPDVQHPEEFEQYLEEAKKEQREAPDEMP